MSVFRPFFSIVPVLSLGLLVSGCAVNTYQTSDGQTPLVTMSAEKNSKKFSIVSAETVTLKAFDDNGQIPAIELSMLNAALKNTPQSMFETYWRQAIPPLENAYGYLNIHTDDTPRFQLASRCYAPLLFADDSIPVKLRVVTVLSPPAYSSGWMTAYLLSLTMAPMKKYNFGAIVVAVIGQDGKTIGVAIVALRHAEWFSGLFPTALFAGGNLTADRCGMPDMESEEKNMQTEIIMQAVTRILCNQSNRVSEPQWDNIRYGVVEALAIGNEDTATQLLDTAHKNKLGGKECDAFRSMMGM